MSIWLIWASYCIDGILQVLTMAVMVSCGRHDVVLTYYSTDIYIYMLYLYHRHSCFAWYIRTSPRAAYRFLLLFHLCSRLCPVGSGAQRLCSRILHACTSIRRLGNRIRCLCNGIRRVCFRISLCTGIRHSKIDQLEATWKQDVAAV